ncbi:MAG TPA: AI-2E family transporter [bacterium]|nr:AI-2E family transporter [bacterium]
MAENKRLPESYRVTLAVLGLIAVAGLIFALKGVFATVTISLVFFYILDPVAEWCTGRRIGKYEVSRVWGAIIAFIVGLLAVTLFFLVLIPPIVDQVERFVDNLPTYMKEAEKVVSVVQQKYRRLELPPQVQNSINAGMERIAASSPTFIRNAAKNTSHFFSQIVLLLMIPFVTFYLLVEKSDVKSALVNVFPKRYQEEAARMLSESSGALRGYISGQLLLSVIMGAAMSICLGLMGVKAPLLLGLIAGVTKLIPVIGIFLGCVPAALVALSASFNLALAVVILFTVVQLLENKVILPLLLSKYVDLSPLTILATLMVGEQVGGVLGMFVATPVAAVLHVIYTHVRAKYD